MMTPFAYYPFSALLRDAHDNELYDEAEIYLLEHTKSIFSLATKRRDDLIRYWAFDYCAKQLFACSPNGQVLHLDEKVLVYNTFYVDMSSSEMAGSKAISIPKDIREDFKFCEPLSEQESNDFNALVEEYYNITEEAAQKVAHQKIIDVLEKKIEEPSQTRPALFFETFTGKIDLRLFDYLDSVGYIEQEFSDERELKKVASELRKIEGWTLAVPNLLLGDSWNEFCNNRAAKHAKNMNSFLKAEAKVVGRPRKRDQAAQAFEDLYPNGIGPDTMVQAAHKISKALGMSVSADTLKRGLGKK